MSEEQRAAAVGDLRILDTPGEERFDRLVREAADAVEAPIAYVAVLDSERQWLKSVVGGLATEIDRRQSFCNRTIQQDQPLVVKDARKDARFKDLPIVKGPPHVRSYAGVPISTEGGHRLGTLCAADTEPREFTAEQVRRLQDVASRVETELNAKPMAFVSYAHEDEEWKDRLLDHCSILRRQGLLDVWEDRAIGSGEEWHEQIRDAIERAKAAVLLISADFLASDFIMQEEIPRILQRRDTEGLKIFPVLLKPCCWEEVPWLAEMNIWPDDARALAGGDETQSDSDLAELAGELADTIATAGRVMPGVGTEEACSAPAAAEPAAACVAEPQPAPAPMPETPAPPAPVPEIPTVEDIPSGRIEVGMTLGPYEVVGSLSHRVFRGRDTRLGHEVAIRTLPDDLVADEERMATFHRAARAVASCNHPNIAIIHGLEHHQGLHCLILELVPGMSLSQRLAAGPLPVPEAIALGIGAAEALEAAHGEGIVHGDLKPGNVMVTPEGGVKLLNLGISASRLADDLADTVGTGVFLRIAPYSSPEQLRDGSFDSRSDIWALGCILFEALCRQRPFHGPFPADTLAAILKDDPDWDTLPDSTPGALRDVLERCLAKDPNRRFQTASEVLGALIEAQS